MEIVILFCVVVSYSYGNMIEMTVAEGPIPTNYCNNTDLLEEAGLIRTTLGQFLGYECSEEFYHCRWQSDGFRTYRKKCKPGLVYDVLGTQNCNYDYNVKSCGVKSSGPVQCNGTDFHCSLSEQCVPMSSRCDGHYDCGMEEDEQNCPLCTAGEFACKVSEQCISLDRRCNGLVECDDGTDEKDCDVCGHGLFHCGKSNECIPVDERCDGRRQCPHGEDEMLCKKPESEKKFTCQSRDFEILSSQVCDGQPQCPDGSDEAYCEIATGPIESGPITFSSNLESKVAPPQPPIPAPKGETDEEEYDYEDVKEEDSEAAFPMLTLTNLQQKIPTTYPPTIAPRTIKPAFSKPKPRVQDIYETKTTPRHKIVHPNLVTVTSSPSIQVTKIPTHPPSHTRYPTRVATELLPSQSKSSRTRRPSIATRNRTEMITRSPIPQKPQSASTEKVFIMQVTAAPPVIETDGESPMVVKKNGEDFLKEITSQINGGMTPELLSKIEKIIKSELQQPSVGNTRFRRRGNLEDYFDSLI